MSAAVQGWGEGNGKKTKIFLAEEGEKWVEFGRRERLSEGERWCGGFFPLPSLSPAPSFLGEISTGRGGNLIYSTWD